MFFISNKINYRFVVRPDETETKFNSAGSPFTVVHRKVLYAEFKADRHIPAEFRQFAIEYFNTSGGRTDWKHPGLNGVTGIGDVNDGVTVDGEHFSGDDPRFRMGILDTSNPQHVAPEDKEEVEQALLNSPLLGQRFINFDTNMGLPWPAYAKLRASNPDDIKKLLQRLEDCLEDGQDRMPQYVIEFENANEKRVTIIKAVEAFIAEHAAVA